MFKSNVSLGSLLKLLFLCMLVTACSSAPKVADKPKPAKIPEAPKALKTDADKRIAAWQELIAQKQNIPERMKLDVVNQFINRLQFVDDIDHWGQEDYWATPLETLRTNGGDCEDFVIAKYFTLKYLQVPEERMRITYVKAKTINKAHMVLSYFLTPEAEPLVLDNLDKEIKPSSLRNDLLPVYSFNAEGLWLAHQQGASDYVGDSERLGLWRELLERMQREPVVSKK